MSSESSICRLKKYHKLNASHKLIAGKGTEKKFLTWLTNNLENKSPRFKLAIKEEMESSKFGIF